MEREEAELIEEAVAAAGAAMGSIVKRPKRDTIGVGTVSGRSWKLPGVRAGTLKVRNKRHCTVYGWEAKWNSPGCGNWRRCSQMTFLILCIPLGTGHRIDYQLGEKDGNQSTREGVPGAEEGAEWQQVIAKH